jgi:hypothetical protein
MSIESDNLFLISPSRRLEVVRELWQVKRMLEQMRVREANAERRRRTDWPMKTSTDVLTSNGDDGDAA